MLFALAHSGFVPAPFARLHPKYGTPYVGIVTLCVLSCLSPLFGRTILVWLIDAGSFAVVIAYIFVPIAFLVLRQTQPDLVRPFRIRYPRLVGGVAVVLGLTLLAFYLPFSPSSLIWPYEWAMVIGWALIGATFYVFRRKRS